MADQIKLTVGSRQSPLALVQVEEVLFELRAYHPHISFQVISMATKGDKDRSTSLRTMGKTDFFTKEIDDMLLKGGCRIAVHSAKDLAEPLTKGLIIAALTKGVDSSDVLVMRQGESLFSLSQGARIATSSIRREEAVKALRSDLTFIDLRGTIGERLQLLNDEQADGVVLAEAALIRLKMTYLNRIKLPGPTTPYQGQLAVVVRENDQEMIELFRHLNA